MNDTSDTWRNVLSAEEIRRLTAWALRYDVEALVFGAERTPDPYQVTHIAAVAWRVQHGRVGGPTDGASAHG